jgi:hypothetical protein
MSNDPTYSNIPLLVTFLKTYKRAYLGDSEAETDDAAVTVDKGELVPPALQAKFRELFNAYFGTASRALVKGQTVRFRFCSCPLRISRGRSPMERNRMHLV